MTVLVTGATGFVGAQVCRELLRRGMSVRAVLRPSSARLRIEDIAPEMDIQELDLFHAPPDRLSALGDGTDCCIHAAWYARPGVYLRALENIECLSGTLRLFECLWKLGCRRIVGVGTCFEYAMTPGPLSESSPLEPATLYAAAKLSTFLTASQLARELGGSFAWARLFYLFGPRENPARLVPDIIGSLAAGRAVPLTEGNQVRDFLHIADAANALIETALSGVQGPVNVASGQGVTVRQLALTLAGLLGRPDLLRFGERKTNLTDPPSVVGLSERLRSSTTWQPAYDLSAGLADTVAGWSSHA